MTAEASMLLLTHADDGSIEPVSIPRAHAEALMAVSAGRIDSLQTSLSLDQHPLRLSRIIAPGLLDLITITFDDDAAASAFTPPAWFGPEVGDDLGYRTSALALSGIPTTPEIEVSNAGLESLLDALENRASGRSEPPPSDLAGTKPRPALPAEPETDDAEMAAIEDEVIRELARSLRPQRR